MPIWGGQADQPAKSAEQVANKLKSLSDLSFEVVITQEVLQRGGDVVTPDEVRAIVLMSGNKLHTRAYRNQQLKVIINADGKLVTEWNEEEGRAIQYPQPRPGDPAYGSFKLVKGMDGCAIGSYLASWVGNDERANWFAKKISGGNADGTADVDGHPCRVITWEKEYPYPEDQEIDLVKHTFYIGQEDHFVYRWVTTQATLAIKTKTVLEQATRTRTYRDISTSPVPPDAFNAQALLDKATPQQAAPKEPEPPARTPIERQKGAPRK